MSRGLPPALSEAIQCFIENISSNELERGATLLSEHYRAGGGSETVRGDATVGAYLAARLPATYAAMTAALEACLERLPQFTPKSLIDAGAGPGTASWAATDIWPHLEAVTMLDHNSHFRTVAAALASAGTSEALKRARILDGTLASIDAGLAADLVLAGYTLGELPDAALEGAARSLWKACTAVLVIVEPGTPDGFARILRCRTALLDQGAQLAAPCPGSYACPIEQPDWCHFSVRLPRSRAHMRAKRAHVPFEDERFSYLAVARPDVVLTPPGPRILSQPQRSKVGIAVKLCADDVISERLVPARDRPAHRQAARKNWGDCL